MAHRKKRHWVGYPTGGDGHARVTKTECAAVSGGDADSHARMVEMGVKYDERVKQRGGRQMGLRQFVDFINEQSEKSQ